MAQWVKDPALPQLWYRLQLWLRSDPWPGTSVFHTVAKKENKTKQNKTKTSYYRSDNKHKEQQKDKHEDVKKGIKIIKYGEGE